MRSAASGAGEAGAAVLLPGGGRALDVWLVAPHPADDRDVAEEMGRIACCIAAGGHGVTLLVAPALDPAVPQDWRCAPAGVRVLACPPAGVAVLQGQPSMRRAFHLHERLARERADVLLVPDCGGLGHYLAVARRSGRPVGAAFLATVCLGPTAMLAEADGRLPASHDDLARDHMERCSVAWADAAILASAPLLDWMAAQGWRLPPRHVVLPPPVLPAGAARAADGAAPAIGEVVFAGGLRRGDGLVLFVEALRRLPADRLAGLRVTLLGRLAPGSDPWDPRRWLEARMPDGLAWSIEEPGEEEDDLAGRLARAGSLVVAPGLGPVAPRPARLCLARAIPFLAADTPALRALVPPDEAERILVPAHPGAFADALRRGLAAGHAMAGAPARRGATARDWQDLVASFVPVAAPAPSPPPRDAGEVSVVLVHRNRPARLAEALEGLRRQTLQGFEVVLVDDGSDMAAALDALDALGAEFAARGWRILRGPNGWLGAARNRGWRAARGRFVLFHDDDNIAMPHQIERSLAAAHHSGAAVVTCALAPFETDAPPGAGLPGDVTSLGLALGGAVALGAFENCFGDAGALVRREVLDATGGFTEDYGLGHEDWEFFARLALAGHEVLALPEPLFWYRVDAASMLRSRADGAPDMRRGMRAYTDRVPPALRGAVLAGIADALALPAARRQAEHLREAVEARRDRIREQRGIIELQAKRLAELRDVAKARLDRIELLRAALAAGRQEGGTGQDAAQAATASTAGAPRPLARPEPTAADAAAGEDQAAKPGPPRHG